MFSATSTPRKKCEPYSECELPEFSPLPWGMKEIRASIPPHLFKRDTKRSIKYLIRDLILAASAWSLAMYIDPSFKSAAARKILTPFGAETLRWASWGIYWWFQGLIFTGIWVIGHECGHGAFSEHKYLNDVVGFVTHSILFTPYFSWKISHHHHHRNHASMERDEVYVPKTRSILGLPQNASELDYDEILGDTPIYTLFLLIRQQILAFPAYLLVNVSGQPNYPKWTNHFDPKSILFTPAQRNAVILSNIGILTVIACIKYACGVFGTASVIKYYGIPWLEVTHWFIMITYLHHTDPIAPHYRTGTWNFQRGAAATIDRPVLGWQGRFFLHDVAHYHVIHHFFPKLPWYHAEEATHHLQHFLGDHYLYSDKPAFQALWENYNKCQFVEDTGAILFYRDKQGQAARRPAAQLSSK